MSDLYSDDNLPDMPEELEDTPPVYEPSDAELRAYYERLKENDPTVLNELFQHTGRQLGYQMPRAAAPLVNAIRQASPQELSWMAEHNAQAFELGLQHYAPAIQRLIHSEVEQRLAHERGKPERLERAFDRASRQGRASEDTLDHVARGTTAHDKWERAWQQAERDLGVKRRR